MWSITHYQSLRQCASKSVDGDGSRGWVGKRGVGRRQQGVGVDRVGQWGRVGGFCPYVLNLKIIHRQIISHFAFMIRQPHWFRRPVSQKGESFPFLNPRKLLHLQCAKLQQSLVIRYMNITSDYYCCRIKAASSILAGQTFINIRKQLSLQVEKIQKDQKMVQLLSFSRSANHQLKPNVPP